MRTITRFLTTGLFVSLLAGSAGAAPIAGFSGYSELGAPCDACDSFVNFTVYETVDDDWTNDSFFSGLVPTALADEDGAWSADVDATARYVFLYQVVNNDPNGNMNENDLRGFNVSRPAGFLPTSAGYFSTAVFVDSNANSVLGGPTGDYSIADPDPALGSFDTPNDGSPSASGILPNGLVGSSGGVDPATVRSGLMIANPDVEGGAGFPSIVWEWSASAEIPSCPALTVGCTSSVLFMTSDSPPVYLWAESESSGGSASAGDVPSIPEPGTLSLTALGLAGLGLRRRRRPSAS